MSYRDELDAARARADSLEKQLAEASKRADTEEQTARYLEEQLRGAKREVAELKERLARPLVAPAVIANPPRRAAPTLLVLAAATSLAMAGGIAFYLMRAPAPASPKVVVEAPPAPAPPPPASRDDLEDPFASSDTLGRDEIQAGMREVRPRVMACNGQHRVPGEVDAHIVIAPDGTVVTAEVTGAFAGTPTGKCVERALASAKFAAATRSTTVRYPFIFR